MSAVDTAIVEINEELGIRGPQYEGLKDFQRLNIQPETMKAVSDLLLRYDKRVGLLTTSRDFLILLRDEPALNVQEVSAAVYADLRDQEVTIAAALAQFASVDPASTLGLTAKTPEPK